MTTQLYCLTAPTFGYAKRGFSVPCQRPQPLSDTHTRREVTEEAFSLFLSWLDPNRDRAGEEYERLRFRLCTFFSQRHCNFADELADETINRLIVNVSTATIENRIAYCLGVARNVYREWLRKQRIHLDINDVAVAAEAPAEPNISRECLDKCLAELPADTRNLLLDYFSEAKLAKIKLHQSISRSLKTSQTAVRMRVMRGKQKLKLCVEHCMTQTLAVPGA